MHCTNGSSLKALGKKKTEFKQKSSCQGSSLSESFKQNWSQTRIITIKVPVKGKNSVIIISILETKH